MDTQPFEYWKPGSEERQLRLFISHRWGHDEDLYASVISAQDSYDAGYRLIVTREGK